MKGVFLKFSLLIFLIITVTSCSSPSAVFTFVNSMTSSFVEIRPAPGEDWTGMTLNAGESATVESGNSNLYFTPWISGLQKTQQNKGYTYSSYTRTYTFIDYP